MGQYILYITFLSKMKLNETLLTVYNIKFHSKLFVFSCSLTELIGNALSKSFGKGGKSPSLSEVHVYFHFSKALIIKYF